ncbi:MAG: flagellar basal body-associated FliL family protein [Pseudomonadota bacterium]
MKKKGVACLCFCLILLSGTIMGCGQTKKGPTTEELLLGTWNRFQNKSYVLWMIRTNGGWGSDVRVEGATSRIIEKRGTASGTWKVDQKSLTLNVDESEIDSVWEKGASLSCFILELNADVLTLQYPNGRVITWNKARAKQKTQTPELAGPPVIMMKPIVVNLNKNRSNDKDRYLCMDLELHLHDLMPDETMPKVHPRAREAMIMYLSSLLYSDVKSFDEVKVVIKKLENILNPYLNGLLKEIKINHVVIASSMDKVEEFLIGHTPASDLDPNKAEQSNAEVKKE